MSTVEDPTGGGAGTNVGADVDKRVVVGMKVCAATEAIDVDVGTAAEVDVGTAAEVDVGTDVDGHSCCCRCEHSYCC